MTTVEPCLHSVPALTSGLRLSAIGRRVRTSDPLAFILADLAYGEPRRSDLSMLSAVTASRCATHAGAR